MLYVGYVLIFIISARVAPKDIIDDLLVASLWLMVYFYWSINGIELIY